MVLLHIITNNRDQAIEIVDFLTEDKLMLHAVIIEKLTGRKRGKDGTFQDQDQILVIGQTKALLFNTIDELLREKYKQHMPVLYSLPIINMDWEQSRELINETLKV